MRIIADTNLLVRSVVLDDPDQSRKAEKALLAAETIAVPLSALCELVWVLRSVYKFSGSAIEFSLQTLLSAATVRVDGATVNAGLEMLRLGGDFADGVVAYEGRVLGGEVFLSFDRKAVKLVQAQGYRAELL